MENNNLNVGDMIYVDAYGPYTYGYSDDLVELKTDKPFRPKLHNFLPNSQYEIIYMDGDIVTLFDNGNNIVDLSTDQLSKEKPFLVEIY
jgi:hypothetical protein